MALGAIGNIGAGNIGGVGGPQGGNPIKRLLEQLLGGGQQGAGKCSCGCGGKCGGACGCAKCGAQRAGGILGR